MFFRHSGIKSAYNTLHKRRVLRRTASVQKAALRSGANPEKLNFVNLGGPEVNNI